MTIKITLEKAASDISIARVIVKYSIENNESEVQKLNQNGIFELTASVTYLPSIEEWGDIFASRAFRLIIDSLSNLSEIEGQSFEALSVANAYALERFKDLGNNRYIMEN